MAKKKKEEPVKELYPRLPDGSLHPGDIERGVVEPPKPKEEEEDDDE